MLRNMTCYIMVANLIHYVLNLNVLHLIDLLLLWTIWIFRTSTNPNILALLLTKLIVTQIWNVKCVNYMLILICSLGNFRNVLPMWNVFLFKSYCSKVGLHPPNLYCSILWYDCSKTALKNLRIAYNNSLQKLLCHTKYNSASEMFVCLNIPSFNERAT